MYTYIHIHLHKKELAKVLNEKEIDKIKIQQELQQKYENEINEQKHFIAQLEQSQSENATRTQQVNKKVQELQDQLQQLQQEKDQDKVCIYMYKNWTIRFIIFFLIRL